ncbi:magnesium transporter MgtE [Amylibacter marinus]|uniref:Magnesium transporter MgtE n=1 Tax=Amylibacter marinus TaxID=1475483 RepID=A0ABQ5VTP8_9RHOB|nr:magnesium transporter [Amylibacter marinus]GLQ34627.1 magnesium transporter MgtE [Amylibacter marinus]
MNTPVDGDSELGERAYEINADLIDAVLDCVEHNDQPRLIALLDPLHAADVADILEQVSPSKRSKLVELWGHEVDGEVLSELDENISAELLEEMPDTVVTEAFKDLETDDVVDLIEELEEDQKERVLGALEDADQVAVRQSLQYPDQTAGRLMQREVVMAPTHWNIGQAIDFLRSSGGLPDEFYEVILVDPRLKPVGKVALFSLLTKPREVLLSSVMDEDFITIPVTQSQEDVAYAFNQYNMVSAPVVDDKSRLVGVITSDDAMEVLGEEVEEDIKRLAGVGDESLTDTIWDTAKQRFPWLAVNLLTSILASLVIAQFTSTIEAIVALAVLMPIVASMGGNAGTQTLTVAVRALATKDLTPANAWRVIGREFSVGVLNGLAFAIIIGGIGSIWYGSAMLGVVLGLAMIINLIVASLAGIYVPLILDRFGVDPALGSSALVTTVTDVIGFLAFLGFAAAILL